MRYPSGCGPASAILCARPRQRGRSRSPDAGKPGWSTIIRAPRLRYAKGWSVIRFHLPEDLAKVPSSTNLLENLFSRVREVAHRVKRRQGGAIVLRWIAAGMLEAELKFRRLRGCRALSQLTAALDLNDQRLDRGNGKLDPKRVAA